MLLLTGATGTVGAPLLRRITAAGIPVRCLVRDPRRLGPERVRVQIALGDLSDHLSFRHALRGVDTVVHLAAGVRDEPGASIEETTAVATWRLVRAAERAGVERFIFFSIPGANPLSPSRLMRAKALAERTVVESDLRHTVFAPSLVYDLDDRYLTFLRRLALAPVVPLPGGGEARFQPIWAEDVADCVLAALRDERDGRFELGGPEVLTGRQLVSLVLAESRRERRLFPVPRRFARRLLETLELLLGPQAPITWDEAELLTLTTLAASGTADAESLGVTPGAMASVLGL